MLGRALAEPVAPGKPEKLNREVISDLFPTRHSRNQNALSLAGLPNRSRGQSPNFLWISAVTAIRTIAMIGSRIELADADAASLPGVIDHVPSRKSHTSFQPRSETVQAGTD